MTGFAPNARRTVSWLVLSLVGLIFSVSVLIGVKPSLAANTSADPSAAPNDERVLPRVIIALLDGDPKDRPRHHRLHYMATMPMEQLGLTVEYHHVAKPLPDLENRADVRGIITWFGTPTQPDALGLIEWLEAALESGKRVVMFGDLPAIDARIGALPVPRINRLLTAIGVSGDGGAVVYPQGADYLSVDPSVFGFEHTPPHPLAFPVWKIADPAAVAHLEVGWDDQDATRSAVVVTGPNGGLVAPDYAAEIDDLSAIRRWQINPFAFFRAAFGTDDLPKPDTTTLSGRRAYYSHVDGDGWRSISEVEIDDRRVSAATVLLDRVVRRYPDLPVTVAPIAAEIDPAWFDDADARAAAKAILALPHVEAGSHTFTHPFQWSFYAVYDVEQERRIVRNLGLGRRTGTNIQGDLDQAPAEGGVTLNAGYRLPRAFYQKPYDLDLEVTGSFERIATVGGKPVRILQWSGDTTPYEAALAATRQAGVPNINGGDTRFDSEFRSYGFVAPVGITVGAERQIYASMSNENTYTDLWTNRHFAYRHVLETMRRTDLPLRVKPVNVYYHTYSAERVSSLNALTAVLEAVREQEIVPIETSRFAAIGQGFYSTRLVALGDRRWRIEDRGALSTIRFDHASRLAVDFAASSGVLGERPSHGSLYVALDPEAEAPVVALTDRAELTAPASAPAPYLFDSRWPVSGLTQAKGGVTARLGGYGRLSTRWIVPAPGAWRLVLRQAEKTVVDRVIAVDDERLLEFVDEKDAVAPLTPTTLILTRRGGG